MAESSGMLDGKASPDHVANWSKIERELYDASGHDVNAYLPGLR